MSRKLTISPADVAERRMAAWVEVTAVEPLEADWVSICFELKRLRNAETRHADLLREALNAIYNLAPRYRDERGGCFGSGHDVPCLCTACKIKRELTL